MKTNIPKTKSRFVLSSIAECRKVIDLLTEAGELEVTEVELRGEPCPNAKLPNSVQPGYRGHRIVPLDDNTLVCHDCGKRFRIRHLPLTKLDRIEFEALNPKRSFSERFAL